MKTLTSMNKFTRALGLLLLLFAIPVLFIPRANAMQHPDSDSQIIVQEENPSKDTDTEGVHSMDTHIEGGQTKITHATDAHAEDVHADGEHKSNMFPLLFIIIALIIGAGTRHWLSCVRNRY